jgi:hypothetical protein
MRYFILSLPVLIAIATVGCDKNDIDEPPMLPRGNDTTATAHADGLAVTLQLPRATLRRGERFTARITVTNLTDEPVEITARSGTPYYLYLYAFDGVSWQRIKTYPEFTTMVMRDWTLQPKDKRTFQAQLKVEPSWPSFETLRLGAIINGLPAAEPYVNIEVVVPQKNSPRQ